MQTALSFSLGSSGGAPTQLEMPQLASDYVHAFNREYALPSDTSPGRATTGAAPHVRASDRSPFRTDPQEASVATVPVKMVAEGRVCSVERTPEAAANFLLLATAAREANEARATRLREADRKSKAAHSAIATPTFRHWVSSCSPSRDGKRDTWRARY